MNITCDNIQGLSWETLVKLLAAVSSSGCAAVRTLDAGSIPVPTPSRELLDDGSFELLDSGDFELLDS